MRPPTPANEAERLAALRRYDILDTPVEAAFEEITQLIARICRTPIAVINLIDEFRQWFKSEVGLRLRETPLDVSVCAHAILQPDLFVVPDLLADQRFACNPLVTGEPHLRFYAGALLETSDGYPIGTLCVLDYEPRELTGEQRDLLRVLARQVMVQLELRRSLAEQARSFEARKRAEEGLHQAQRMEAVGRLAGGIAHDLNNMLLAVLGYTRFAADQLPSDHPAQEDLLQVKVAADRSATLTRQLLAFARRDMHQPALLDVNRLVGETERLLASLLGEHVALGLDVAPGLAVLADRSRLEQVFVNLAVNARAAMPEGGRFTITADRLQLDAELARGYPDGEIPPGDYVRLRTTDTGHGMDRATLARIFEPFFTTKPVGEGTGLGLSMVYGTVKQMGGFVWAESEPGRGATFTLCLPAASDTTVAGGNGDAGLRLAAPTPTAHSRATVLVVDDEQVVREVACRMLQTLGYTAVQAADGSAALEAVRRDVSGIDLVLADIVMPGMSGRELGRRLASLRPSMTVLYMSAYAAEEMERRGLLEPGQPLLQKPFSPATLATAIRQLLRPTGPVPIGPP